MFSVSRRQTSIHHHKVEPIAVHVSTQVFQAFFHQHATQIVVYNIQKGRVVCRTYFMSPFRTQITRAVKDSDIYI